MQEESVRGQHTKELSYAGYTEHSHDGDQSVASGGVNRDACVSPDHVQDDYSQDLVVAEKDLVPSSTKRPNASEEQRGYRQRGLSAVLVILRRYKVCLTHDHAV